MVQKKQLKKSGIKGINAMNKLIFLFLISLPSYGFSQEPITGLKYRYSKIEVENHTYIYIRDFMCHSNATFIHDPDCRCELYKKFTELNLREK